MLSPKHDKHKFAIKSSYREIQAGLSRSEHVVGAIGVSRRCRLATSVHALGLLFLSLFLFSFMIEKDDASFLQQKC
jgi:hypothetical protein